MQERSVVGWADDSSTLGSLLNAGKKIIITTIHKFPFILSSIGTENKDKQFAIIIDEAHSSQTGSLFAKMNMAVSGNVCDDEEDIEDKINKLIEGHRMVRNANYYAFTATPKTRLWRCLEMRYHSLTGKYDMWLFIPIQCVKRFRNDLFWMCWNIIPRYQVSINL